MSAENAQDIHGGHCEVCEVSGLAIPAKFYCVNCVVLMCDSCKADHEQQSLLTSHVVQVYTAERLLQETPMCITHVDKPAPYWCKKCSVPVCIVCALACHKTHNMTDIKSYIQDIITPLKNTKESVKCTLSTLDDNVGYIADKIKQLQEDVEKMKTEIEKQATYIIKRVVEEKNKLILKLEDSYKPQINNLKCCLDNQQNNMKTIEEWELDLKTILSQTTDTSALTEVKDHIVKGVNLAGQDAISIGDLQLYVFDANINYTTIGELVLDKPGGDFMPDKSGGQLADKSGSGLVPDKPDVRLLCSDTVSGGSVNDITLLGRDKICVLQDRTVILYEHQGETIRLIHRTHFNNHSLRRAAARDANNVYMTCRACESVHLYDVISRQLSVNVDQWRSGMFSDPYGVAVTTSGNVVVGDNGISPRQVFVHKPNGEELYALGGATGPIGGYPNLTFGDPDNLACDGETIIISNRSGHCVFICEYKSTHPTTIGQTGRSGSADDKLNKPKGICATDQGSIIVADNGNSRVSEYTSGRVLRRHILSPDTPNFGKPRLVDFIRSRGRRLLLVLHGNADIGLFEI